MREVGGCLGSGKASDTGGFELGEEGLGHLVVDMGWRLSRLGTPDCQSSLLSLLTAQTSGTCLSAIPPPPSSRKQCIELEQQFDFLKDLVASVPDMQGDGEDNHLDGDKGSRRWGTSSKCPGREGQGHWGRGWLGGG